VEEGEKGEPGKLNPVSREEGKKGYVEKKIITTKPKRKGKGEIYKERSSKRGGTTLGRPFLSGDKRNLKKKKSRGVNAGTAGENRARLEKGPNRRKGRNYCGGEGERSCPWSKNKRGEVFPHVENREYLRKGGSLPYHFSGRKKFWKDDLMNRKMRPSSRKSKGKNGATSESPREPPSKVAGGTEVKKDAVLGRYDGEERSHRSTEVTRSRPGLKKGTTLSRMAVRGILTSSSQEKRRKKMRQGAAEEKDTRVLKGIRRIAFTLQYAAKGKSLERAKSRQGRATKRVRKGEGRAGTNLRPGRKLRGKT